TPASANTRSNSAFHARAAAGTALYMRKEVTMRSFLASIAAVLVLAGCANALMLNAAPPRSDDIFLQIQPGMTTDDVRRLIGPPDETMAFPLSRTDSWGY